jgi:hypothetical protein
MSRSVSFAGLVVLFAAAVCPAQSSDRVLRQDPATTPSQSQAKPSTTPVGAKNSKKVWTNENLADANGPVSVVGDPKNPGKGIPGSDKPADPQYVANARKQLEKLQADLADANKQLLALRNFTAGEPSTSAGKQLNKSYNRTPVDQQIVALEEKKKQTQAKIDALVDEARKKGVEPGQLR